MKNPCFSASFRFAAALALTATVASAAIKNRITNYTFNTAPQTFHSGYSHYVDWSTTGNSSYSTMSFNNSTVPYFDFTSYAFSGATSRCFTLTSSGAGTVADTEILIKNSQNVWVKLADDVNGTHAMANFWFTAGGNTRSNPRIRVIAYNSNHNQEAFMFSSAWYTENYVTCVDGLPGGTFPAAAIIDGNGIASIYRVK